MNNKFQVPGSRFQVAVAIGLSFVIRHSSFAQGSLTPSGAPAPTMKSLDQLEPRTPISSAPYTISISGAYYLTTNLATGPSGNSITIATNSVSLDLNGFTLFSANTNAAGHGVLIKGGLSDIAIFNGHICGGVTNNGSGVYSGPGFNFGIFYSGTPPVNIRVSHVSVSGCLNHGIDLYAGSSTVESCMVHTVGGNGIVAATVKGSEAMDCGGTTAIFANTVSDSQGQATGSGEGIFSVTAHNSYGSSSTGVGISTTTAQNCYGSSSTGDGIDATSAHDCYGLSFGSGNGILADTVANSEGFSSSGTGITANQTAQNCYGTSSSGDGIDAGAALNCTGTSGGAGEGILAQTAVNCSGSSSVLIGLYTMSAIGCYGATASSASPALYAQATASFCTGNNSTGGTAIQADLANGCVAIVGTNNVSHKYNMP